MRFWKLLKRLCFRRRQEWYEVKIVPGTGRPAIERGWSGERLTRALKK